VVTTAEVLLSFDNNEEGLGGSPPSLDKMYLRGRPGRREEYEEEVGDEGGVGKEKPIGGVMPVSAV